MRFTCLNILAFVPVIGAATGAPAQTPAGVTRSSSSWTASSRVPGISTTAETAASHYGSFGLQAVSGTLGSLAGLGIGLALTNDCTGEDDVVCALETLSIAGALGVVGATAGVAVAGRTANQRPSIVGGLLGAAAGTVIGVGLHHLITEEMNQRLNDAGTLALFTISQGSLAAAGARLGATLRARGR
jgi:hypothetical protein